MAIVLVQKSPPPRWTPEDVFESEKTYRAKVLEFRPKAVELALSVTDEYVVALFYDPAVSEYLCHIEARMDGPLKPSSMSGRKDKAVEWSKQGEGQGIDYKKYEPWFTALLKFRRPLMIEKGYYQLFESWSGAFPSWREYDIEYSDGRTINLRLEFDKTTNSAHIRVQEKSSEATAPNAEANANSEQDAADQEPAVRDIEPE
ncbi:MAG: hypothetical protein R3F19_04115 [Verrucomicrobiales bacterium]